MKHNYVLKIAFFFLLITKVSYGQILTFDMAGIGGSEVSHTSNTNNANLTTSTLTRGAGLTASGNADRFNATSWALTNIANAVSGNDYMEFTITPNSGFQFTVSSITINIQRSGTGPSAVALRSSVDNYAANLDTEKTIVDNTSTQSFTFTFTQSNSNSAVTYRFYMYAESTGGSGGIGDGVGNDLVVNGTTSAFSTPTVGFDTLSSSGGEGSTILIPVTFTNYSAPVTLNVTANGASTASTPTNYTGLTSSLTFSANGTQNVSVTLPEDSNFANETLIIDLSIASGTANFANQQYTLTITDNDIPNLVISEIMYNSPSTDDEWIELYNNQGSNVDISGFVIQYNSSTIYTFPASTIFNANSYITIAIGSNGDGSYNNDNPFTPDFNSLSVSNANVATTNDTNKFANSTGTISFKTGTTTIDEVTYSSSDISSTNGNGNTYEIMSISSANAVTSSNWQASIFNGGSPKRASGSVWSGATDTDWNTASNWSNGLPMATSDVLIPASLSNYPTANSAVTVNSVSINSGGRLIANSTFTGTVTYNRNLGTSNWYLMSSPVAGVSFNDAFVTANNIDSGTGNNKGVATYTTASNTWSYLQAAGSIASTAGIGYSVKRTASGNVAFTGTLNTSNVSVAVSNAGTGFNLIGNPFTAAINSASFLTDNTSSLFSQTLWVFNQSTGVYETKITGDTFIVAPTQGFFVRSSNGTNLSIAESYQTTGGTFQKSARTEVVLNMTDGSNNRYAKMYYLANATKGFDNGYDGEVFGGIENAVDLFTHLVANNEGKKYQVQSLPISEMESMIVPVGVKAAAGKEITFTAEASNLPNDVKVFLEDKVANTITRLDEANATYKVTLSETLDGIGRFYLHTKTAGVLSTEDALLESVSIYAPSKSTLRIEGISQGAANVRIFSILGKEVFANNYKTSGIIEVNLPALSSGLYVIQVATEKGNINKKITLE